MTEKILFVDDDPKLLQLMEMGLRKQFNVETALNGVEGLKKIADDGPFALVVADMQMPGMSGLDFLRHAQTQAPETVRLMLTGITDQKTAVDAVNSGRVFGFLNKPCPAASVAPILEAGLEQFRLLRMERELLENTLGGALSVLTEILATIDPATFERGQRLREICREFGEATGLAVTWETETAALLLAIGRVTIPPSVLEKVRLGQRLNAAEDELVREVPELGSRLLERIPRLENVAAIVRHQHQRFDGTAGEIPFGARLLKFLGDLADLESQGLTRPGAWRKLQQSPGRYDPEILSAAARWCRIDEERQSVQPTKSAQSSARELPINELRIGQILAQDVFSKDGLLLLAAESRLTGMLLTKLHNFRQLQFIPATLLVRSV